MHTEFWSVNLKGRHYLENKGQYGRIILEWAFNKLGPVVGYCERGKEPSKERYFLINCAAISFL
jgi:hypothetical protein